MFVLGIHVQQFDSTHPFHVELQQFSGFVARFLRVEAKAPVCKIKTTPWSWIHRVTKTGKENRWGEPCRQLQFEGKLHEVTKYFYQKQ